MVTFTADAYTELSRRVAECDDSDPYVSVIWLTAQLDLVRSPDGKAVWKEITPAQWAVSVRAFPNNAQEMDDEPVFSEDYVRWLKDRLMQVGDLRVHFQPNGSGFDNVTVAYSGGHFRVQPSDA